MKLRLDESRRLTGPNLLWEKPGAIVDVFIDEGDPQQVAQGWQRWAKKLLTEFDWATEQSTHRLHGEGANLAISAPMDALYAACELAELIWCCAAAELQAQPIPDWQARLAELRVELADERNPELIALMAAAKKNAVSLLADDDEISLGMGQSVDVWPVDQLPKSDSVNWHRYCDIPTAYVTGTNGKSTSVRLADAIAKAAGLNSGVTSTDFIRVGDDIIDYGDYSGPGGARTLLRDPRTEIAFMEVARGGILRRGLPIPKVKAALVTNVANDHLGQYGINTVAELAEVKFVVAKALDEDAVLVVNADNQYTAAQASKAGKRLCWFSTDFKNEHIQRQLTRGEPAVSVKNGAFVYLEDGGIQAICEVNDTPMTMQGSAAHNIQNALGVIGLSKALGLPRQAIIDGLKAFGSTPEDNPGRGNIYQLPHCKVIVDFAHNEHSMRAVVQMVNRMPATNRTVMFGHAGDRTDKDIYKLTRAVSSLAADHYIISEYADYLRGRELGELPALMTKYLDEFGALNQQISVVDGPLEGVKLAVERARKGDVLLLFVLDKRQQVHDWLTRQAQQ